MKDSQGIRAVLFLSAMTLSFVTGGFALNGPSDLPAAGPKEKLEWLKSEKENLEFERQTLQDHLDFMDFNCTGAQSDPSNIQRCNVAENYVNMNKNEYEMRLEAYEEQVQKLKSTP